VRITLTEGTLIRPVRVELRYDPGRIPKGMPEEALFIARYDEVSQRWIGLVSSQVDATQKLVVAEVERFSMLQVMSFEPGWLLDKAFQSFQKVFGGGVKTIIPVCGPPGGVIVEPVGNAWEVLLVCAERDGNNIVVRVANNRHYGLILFYPPELQLVSREVGGGPELKQLLAEVLDSLETWIVANPPQALFDRAKRISIAYLPPGALVTLRGSWGTGEREIGAIAGRYTLSLDAALAFADFLRLILVVHFGVDPLQFINFFETSLSCIKVALTELKDDPRDLSMLWESGLGACFLNAVKTAAKKMGLHPIANVLSAAGLVADLGKRLTALTQVATDVLTGKWPSVVRIHLPLVGPCGGFGEYLSPWEVERVYKFLGVIRPNYSKVEEYELWRTEWPDGSGVNLAIICPGKLRLPVQLQMPFDGDLMWPSEWPPKQHELAYLGVVFRRGPLTSGPGFGFTIYFSFLRGFPGVPEPTCPGYRENVLGNIICRGVKAGQVVVTIPTGLTKLRIEIAGISPNEASRYIPLIFR